MKQESGNALFFILIGILLFGALSYAVSETGSSGNNTEREEMESAIGELYHYAAALEQAVNKIKLMNGCGENDIDFYADGINSVNYEHASDNPRCKIFHAKGGGLAYAETPTNILDSSGGQQYRFTGQQAVSGIGSDAAELIFGARINRLACIEINKDLGIGATSDFLVEDDDMAGDISLVFNGGNTANGGYGNTLVLDELGNKKTGCVHDANDGYYFYYHVLLAR